MPNRLLEIIHEEHGIPMAELEEYWQKAKTLASGRDVDNYWSYVTSIFRNMLDLKSENKLADPDQQGPVTVSSCEVFSIFDNMRRSTSAGYPEWWKKLSPKERLEYLQDHPESKLGDSKVTVKDTGDSDLSDESQKNSHIFSDSDTESDVQDAAPEGVSMKSLIQTTFKKHTAAMHAHLSKNKAEVKAVGKFLSGDTLDKSEQEHALNFAKKAGALLVGALVVASLATPLAGHGAELGQYFLQNYSDISNTRSESSDDEPVSKFLAQFQDWLASQDTDKLAAIIKEQQQ